MTPKPHPFRRAMPVLEVVDMAASLAFYKDKLGFAADTWGDPASFAIVQRGRVTLALALALVAAPAAVSRRTWAAYVYVDDVDALFAELSALGVAIPHPPTTRPYNCREILADDPDGHMIAFGQVLAPDAAGPGLSARIARA